MATLLKVVKTVVIPNADGNVNVTDVAAFGGETPKFAIITAQDDNSQGVVSNRVRMSYGAATSTGNAVCSIVSANGQTTTQTAQQTTIFAAYSLINASTSSVVAAGTATLIANGIRINPSIFAIATRLNILLVGGTQVEEARLAVKDFTGLASPQNMPVPFRADAIVSFGGGSSNAGGVDSGASLSIGYGTRWDNRNVSCGYASRDGVGTSAVQESSSFSDSVSIINENANGSYAFSGYVSAYASDGFDVTFSGTDTNKTCAFLAIKLKSPTNACIGFDFINNTQSGGGSTEFTMPRSDRTPEVCLASAPTSTSTTTITESGALVGGLYCWAFDGTTSASTAIWDKDAATASRTQTLSSGKAALVWGLSSQYSGDLAFTDDSMTWTQSGGVSPSSFSSRVFGLFLSNNNTVNAYLGAIPLSAIYKGTTEIAGIL